MLPLLMGAHRPEPGVGPETVYELRIYHLNEGKLPLILKRFHSHEIKIFERLGMTPIAFWTPTDPPDEGRTRGRCSVEGLQLRSRVAGRQGREREGRALRGQARSHVPQADRLLAGALSAERGVASSW
jgi:hypothetical protein